MEVVWVRGTRKSTPNVSKSCPISTKMLCWIKKQVWYGNGSQVTMLSSGRMRVCSALKKESEDVAGGGYLHSMNSRAWLIRQSKWGLCFLQAIHSCRCRRQITGQILSSPTNRVLCSL